MISVPVIFIILGILIKYCKMYFLIAGYNTMPKEEQEKYDIDGIASVFRNAMFGIAFIMICGYLLSRYLDNPDIEKYSFFGALFIGIPYLLIASNSKKYKINK